MLRKTFLATFCALMITTFPALAVEVQSEQGTLEVTPIATGLESTLGHWHFFRIVRECWSLSVRATCAW